MTRFLAQQASTVGWEPCRKPITRRGRSRPMSDLPTRPQVGDYFVLVGTMPSGGVWGYPFGHDTWLVRMNEPRRVATFCNVCLSLLDEQWPDESGCWHCGARTTFRGMIVEVTDDE